MSNAPGGAVCENCGKRVLPSDTLCWHCGHRLTRSAAPDQLDVDRPAADAVAPPPPDYDLRAIAIYGVLTLVLIAGLLLVMRALGQRPILVRSAGLEIADDWIQLTDSQLRYTLSVPGGWQWLDVPFRDQQSVLADLIERQPYVGRALNPLGATAGDVTIEGVALGSLALELPEPVPFVIIGTSPRLRELEPQQALALLAESPLPALELREDTSVPLQPQARFSVLDAPYAYQCRHLFVSDQDATAYLVAACAPQAEFATMQRDLDEILDSFQLLER